MLARYRQFIAYAAVLISSLACRPVIAIGWTELAIIVVLVIVLFAPLLFRLFRFFTQKDETASKEND